MKNPISFISNFLVLHFVVDGNFVYNDDGSECAPKATGFLYRKNEEIYLVTNLHVVSGRDIFTKQCLNKMGALPRRITFAPSVIKQNGQVTKPIILDIPLYDNQNHPLWLVHPQFRRDVDIAAIPVKIDNSNILSNEDNYYCINDVSFINDLLLEITDDVFVVGYPYGKCSTFTTDFPIPIWKRASIASELDISYFWDERPVFLVDTTTKVGMSGSPVIGMPKGVIRSVDGSISLSTGSFSMQLLGIYSGRIDPEQKEDSCLGLVWKKELIDEIIDTGIQDEIYE